MNHVRIGNIQLAAVQTKVTLQYEEESSRYLDNVFSLNRMRRQARQQHPHSAFYT